MNRQRRSAPSSFPTQRTAGRSCATNESFCRLATTLSIVAQAEAAASDMPLPPIPLSLRPIDQLGRRPGGWTMPTSEDYRQMANRSAQLAIGCSAPSVAQALLALG